MAANTMIEWADHTFNPWRGCAKVSPGCQRCFAERISKRNPAVLGSWGTDGRRIIASDRTWAQPVAWNRAAEASGQRARVFCASMADVFEARPELALARLRLFDLIRQTPWLDWLLLTKRPENVAAQLAQAMNAAYGVPQRQSDLGHWLEGWLTAMWVPENVWLGVSVEDQLRLRRFYELNNVSGRIKFLSCEPLLGPLDFTGVPMDSAPSTAASWSLLNSVDWVIIGGESGAGARPCKLDWIREIVRQCRDAKVPVFVKQLGANVEVEADDAIDGADAFPSKVKLAQGSFPGYTRLRFKDPKGGDMAEFPEDLRIREFPRKRSD